MASLGFCPTWALDLISPGALAVWGSAQARPPGPPQRPISVSQVAVAANEAQDGAKLQLPSKFPKCPGKTPAGPTDQAVALRTWVAHRGRCEEQAQRAGVLWETTGGCQGGRGG